MNKIVKSLLLSGMVSSAVLSATAQGVLALSRDGSGRVVSTATSPTGTTTSTTTTTTTSGTTSSTQIPTRVPLPSRR